MTYQAYRSDQKDLETKILADYSIEKVEQHLEFLTGLIRRAGTDDELKAAEYIKAKLDEYGVEARIYEVEAYISILKEARLKILHPVEKSLPCLSGAFTPPTPAGGIEGELVWGIDLKPAADLNGKIVLIDGPKESRKRVERTAHALY